MKKAIFINEDDSHFTSAHPAGDMTREGIERLADFYCQDTQVGGVLFCVNYQKALYRSAVWEYVCDGYDPSGPDTQPFLRNVDLSMGGHGRNMLDNMLALEARGLDRYQLWIDRCRYHGVEGWLTLRMNDCHGLQEYRQRIEEGFGNYCGWALLCPSEFWKKHPEYRRAAYRNERSLEGAFDFSRAEVREYHLKLVAEVLGKWDMDGVELDWLRWGMHFRPGHEAEGRDILTAFMQEVRRLARAAETRLGHPVKVGCRIPSELRAGWHLGYDGVAWARQGLVDQLVLGSFGGFANFDVPLEEWRLLCGGNVRLIVQAEDTFQPYPGFRAPLVGNLELQRGVSANALHRGADGVYLFNDCYFETQAPESFKQTLQVIGSPETLSKVARRHSTASPGVRAPGDPTGAALPEPFTNPIAGYDFGRFEDTISVRIFTGDVPAQGTAILHLGASTEAPPLEAGQLNVRLNTVPLQPSAVKVPAAPEVNRVEWCNPMAEIGQLFCFEVPMEILTPDNNLVELTPPCVGGNLVWAEISFHPPACKQPT